MANLVPKGKWSYGGRKGAKADNSDFSKKEKDREHFKRVEPGRSTKQYWDVKGMRNA